MKDSLKYLQMAEELDGENEEIASHIRTVTLEGEKR